MTGSFISSLVIGHRNSSGTETEIIVILSSSIFCRTLLRRPRDSEKLFVHEVASTRKAKKSGLEIVSSCATGDTAPSRHPPKPKACSQPWLPPKSTLPQAVSLLLCNRNWQQSWKQSVKPVQVQQSHGRAVTWWPCPQCLWQRCPAATAWHWTLQGWLSTGQSSASGRNSHAQVLAAFPFTLTFNTAAHTTPVQHCWLGPTKR